jgi:hypothetical protein
MRRERKLRMRRVLVAAQIAVSFVVLTTAALFLQNLLRTNSMSAGFDVNHTIHAEAFLPPHAYPDGQDHQSLHRPGTGRIARDSRN